ncbi:hypothetical protein JAAARDRAFT_46223 [Jaapia argillacea MUCL 33604]|uniref:Non-ribosomal peptide synthetase n=1 Tax=Jaapia argillacea MUCL 33604 TaxID=933084 RepID=A0A067Q014_9AGAM|nr:hypothetical protein JAAARDRAFT_46223 [Jaapia argillacea MUCL 33604]
MSAPRAPNSAAPPYDDPEKGTLEIQAVHPTVVTLGLSDKKGDTTISTEVVPAPPVKKETPAIPPAKKPSPKQLSSWTLLKLWYNTYRKFFTVVFTLNMIALGFTIAGYWQYPVRYPGALIVGNISFGVMMRNELFGRTLYLIVNTLFAKWSPMWFRLACTSTLQHLGGIHSGCTISGIAWLIWRVVTVFKEHRIMPNSILTMGVISNFILVICAISAFPWVRNTHHNVFERHHRFSGWSGLGATWIFVIFSDLYDTETGTYNFTGPHIVRQQDFWFVLALTFLVPVDIELPSPKVAVIRFQRGMQQGLLSRISRSAVWEYHAFGVISEGPHAKYHYLIAGVQGDFTRSLVNDPPTHLWTRQLKVAGVSNTSNLYRRGIRVCTGTGLGAALATCIQSPYWYLIWIGSDQEKTFGPTISGLIHRHLGPERYTLWDSKQRGGRPDVMKIVKEVHATWQAEVVFITSNYQGNQEVMAGCKEAGIPAFGTLWDF